MDNRSDVVLARVQPSDLQDLFRLHSDPAVWRHLPEGRHESVERTAKLVDAAVSGWREYGLDYWTIRDAQTSQLVGLGGAAVECDDTGTPLYWNIYYRIAPSHHGRGIATYVAAQGKDAAVRHDPSLPILAILLAHNGASAKVATRMGLAMVAEGPDTEHAHYVRQIYADRSLPPSLLERLQHRWMASAPDN